LKAFVVLRAGSAGAIDEAKPFVISLGR